MRARISVDDNQVYEDGLCNSVLKVSCPNLISFKYIGHNASDYSLENLSFLEYGSIYLLGPKPGFLQRLSDEEIEEFGYHMSKILSGLCHAIFLFLCTVFLQYFYLVLGEPGCFSASFHNLKSLKLCTKVTDTIMAVVIYLLEHSSNLESLILVLEKTCEWTEYWELDGDAFTLFTCHLKRVEFLTFKGCFSASLPYLRSLMVCTRVNNSCMEVVMYLLELSPNLESFTLAVEKTCEWNEYWELDDEYITLFTCHLKTVRFLNFKGEEGDLEFISFLLENGNVLRK